MDNNDQNKTVVVEKDRDHVNNSNPWGAVIAIIVLLVLAALAYNLFTNSGDTQTGDDTTNVETTLPNGEATGPATTPPAPQE